jgi:hypothetical protein
MPSTALSTCFLAVVQLGWLPTVSGIVSGYNLPNDLNWAYAKTFCATRGET